MNSILSRFRWVGAALCVALLAVAFVPHDVAASVVHSFTHHAVPGLSMALMVPVVAKSKAQLDSLINPQGAEMEAVRATLYDTQLYTSAVTTQLTFFTAINADKTLSNQIGNGGTLPDGNYFEVWSICCDVMANATLSAASTQVGILDDINKLLFIGRGTLQLTLGDKTIPRIPMSFLHGSGGAVGSVSATLTAPNSIQVGTNGVQDGGYFFGGSLVIPPNAAVALTLSWAAAQTLNFGNPNIRISLDGVWHRPVR